MCICMSRIWPILTCDMASETYISCIGLFCLVLCQKRPIYETFCDKRDLCMRPMNVWQTHDSFVCVTWQKRRTCATKRELYIRRIYERHTYRYVYMSQARISHSKRDVDMGQKETCIDGKRDIYIWQKRPTHMKKETHVHRQSHISMRQNKPTHMTKETHIHRLSRMAKTHPHTPDLMHWRPRSKTWWISCSITRDTYIWQKRPAYVTQETHTHRLSQMAKSHSHTPDLMYWRPRSKTWWISCSMTRDTYICDNRDLHIW